MYPESHPCLGGGDHNKLKVFERTFLASTGHVDFVSRMYLLSGPSPLEPWLGLDELGGCSACSWALDLSTNATHTLPAVGLEQAEEIFVIISRLTQPDNDPIRLEIDAEH